MRNIPKELQNSLPQFHGVHILIQCTARISQHKQPRNLILISLMLRVNQD